MSITNAWYRFIKTGGQKWLVFDGKLILKRDDILESFSEKFRTQIPWVANNLGYETEKGGIRNAIIDILRMWYFDNPRLEDKIRQSKASNNSKKLKLYYQAAVKMTTIEPCDLAEYR